MKLIAADGNGGKKVIAKYAVSLSLFNKTQTMTTIKEDGVGYKHVYKARRGRHPFSEVSSP